MYVILCPTLIIKLRDASVILFPTINDKSPDPSNEIIRIIFYTKVCNIISDADLQVSPQFISEEDYEMEGENEILCTPKPKQLRKSNKGKSYEYY
jgi:hypothetical protein